MSTPNLNLDHITESQENKEVTANEAFDGLDNAMNSELALDVSSGDVTLTAAQFRGARYFRLTGTPGGDFTLRVPASISREFVVHNFTGNTCIVETEFAGTDAILIPQARSRILYSDGADIVAYGSQDAATGGYDEAQIQNAAASLFLTDVYFEGGRILVCTSASPQIIYVPEGLSNTQSLTVILKGTGGVAFEEGDSAVQIHSPGSARSIDGQYGWVTIVPDIANADEYFLEGRLV